jgi:hypothetical protein
MGYTKRCAQRWAYTVPFKVKNAEIIEKLLQRESQGAKISRADSGGIFPGSVLQFHRAPLWDAEFDVEVLLYASGIK